MAVSAFSQTIWSDNFESYNVGNLGTQGGWQNDGVTTASWTKVANITPATYGKSFQLGSTVANADGAWKYREFDPSIRTSGNDIFVVEYDYYTGTSGTDAAGVVQIYNTDDGYLNIMEIGYTDGYLYLADAYDGIYLDENASVNTWYHIKAAFDSTTGEIRVKLNNNDVLTYEGYNPGYLPNEFDVLMVGDTTAGFDNIVVSATNADPFLAVSDVTKKSSVSVYPNPATDVVNIKSDKKVENVSIYDVAGKIVKTTTETSINVENLAKGSYIVSIKYVDGSKESTKVIKK